MFIELNVRPHDNNKASPGKVWFSVDAIAGLQDSERMGNGAIVWSQGAPFNPYYVEETPREILFAIEEAKAKGFSRKDQDRRTRDPKDWDTPRGQARGGVG